MYSSKSAFPTKYENWPLKINITKLRKVCYGVEGESIGERGGHL